MHTSIHIDLHIYLYYTHTHTYIYKISSFLFQVLTPPDDREHQTAGGHTYTVFYIHIHTSINIDLYI